MQWIEVDAPEGHKLIAAVWRPTGVGPFPVVVVLHASAGFSTSTILLGRDFATAGFIAVAGAWFAGHDPNWFSTTIIDSPNAPAFSGANFNSIKYADAIIKVARTLHGANGKMVGIIGQSRGAEASVLLASTGAGVQAVVADSAGYTNQSPIDASAISVVQNLSAPLLILHGTADQTANVQRARDYEQALRRLNKPYEVKYYEGSSHVVTIKSNPNYADAMGRAIAFFTKHLTP